MIWHFNIDDTEISRFVARVQDRIRGSLDALHEACANSIAAQAHKLVLSPGCMQDLQHRVRTRIVSPYVACADALVAHIDAEVADFFGLDRDASPSILLDENVFAYRINERLINEYYKTERRAEVMEKLIDETLAASCPGPMESPVKKVLERVSPGAVCLGSMGLSLYHRKKLNKRDICRRLAGISKNINIRIQKSLLEHYAAQIYRLAEELPAQTEYRTAS